VDQAVLRLGVLPQPLNREDGGRVFVETKSGVLPLLGIRPTTRVRFLKEVGGFYFWRGLNTAQSCEMAFNFGT
jgi:hypothetical protein